MPKLSKKLNQEPDTSSDTESQITSISSGSSEAEITTHSPLGSEEIVDRLPPYFTISCVSARNSGKSVLIQELVRKLIKAKRVDMVLIMSGSAGLNEDWTFLPSNLVIPFSTDTLDRIWNKQKMTPIDEREHILVVLDDCLATPEAFRNQRINAFYSLGRHLTLSMMILSQHTAYLLSPIIKANSDIILWSKLNRQQLKSLWESTTNLEWKAFLNFSETLGGVDYNFLLLDIYCKSNRPEEFLTFVRAEPPAKTKKNKVDGKGKEPPPDARNAPK
jgi:hypothetical protein